MVHQHFHHHHHHPHHYYHKKKQSEPLKHPEIMHIFLMSLLHILALILLLFSLFFPTNYSLNTMMEIQKDYHSHPILSISPFLSSPSNSQCPSQSFLLLEQEHSFYKTKKCKKAKRSLVEKTNIDRTFVEFDYMNETYQSLLEKAVSKGEKCPEGYKQCGILDSLNNIMCIEEDKQCPVNLIVVNKEKNAPSRYTFKTEQLNTSYIHYTNEAIDNYIVTKFVNISEEEIELSPFESKPNEDLSDYSFEDCKIKEMKYSQMNLYHEIGTNLLSRPFIGVDMKCLPDGFYNEEKILKDYNTGKTLLIIYYVLTAPIVLITFWLMAYFIIVIDDIKLNFDIIAVITIIVLFLVEIACLTLNIFMMIIKHRLIMKLKCFDENTNTIHSVVINEYETDGWWITVIIIISIMLLGTFGFGIAFLVKRIPKIIEQYEEEKKKESLLKDQQIEAPDVNNQ